MHVLQHDPDLSSACVQNAKRYINIFSEAVFDLLPKYKQRDVVAKDTLDVYIEHRLLLRQRIRGEIAPQDPRNMYPMELLKRL